MINQVYSADFESNESALAEQTRLSGLVLCYAGGKCVLSDREDVRISSILCAQFVCCYPEMTGGVKVGSRLTWKAKVVCCMEGGDVLLFLVDV
jgi:hypothetical protein